MGASRDRALQDEVEAFVQQSPMRVETTAARPRRRRTRTWGSVDLTINSLLDILSVILVFLMKSYSTTSVQIKPSPELQVPFSHSAQVVAESTAITLTRKNILVDDRAVMSFDEASMNMHKGADGSPSSLLLEPLAARLHEEVALQKKIERYNRQAGFKGIVSFIIDRHVPFALVTRAMYTAGQSGFTTFKFVLIRTER